jgi:hypothetical protein
MDDYPYGGLDIRNEGVHGYRFNPWNARQCSTFWTGELEDILNMGLAMQMKDMKKAIEVWSGLVVPQFKPHSRAFHAWTFLV